MKDIWRESALATAHQKTLHLIIMTGGLGDIIASDPAIRKIIGVGEHVVILARPSYLGAFEFNPDIDAAIRVDSYVQALILQLFFRSNSRLKWTNLHPDKHRCNMFQIALPNRDSHGVDVKNYYDRRTLADVYSWIVSGTLCEETPKLYPDLCFDGCSYLNKAFDNSSNPVLFFHPKATAELRSLPDSVSCHIVEQILEKSALNVVEMGLDPVLKPGKRIHLVANNLTLGEQFSLMSHANAFLGVDSGFAHAAQALGLPSVMILLDCFNGFKDYLPWQANARTTVVRARKSLSNLNIFQVVDAINGLQTAGFRKDTNGH